MTLYTNAATTAACNKLFRSLDISNDSDVIDMRWLFLITECNGDASLYTSNGYNTWREGFSVDPVEIIPVGYAEYNLVSASQAKQLLATSNTPAGHCYVQHLIDTQSPLELTTVDVMGESYDLSCEDCCERLLEDLDDNGVIDIGDLFVLVVAEHDHESISREEYECFCEVVTSEPNADIKILRHSEGGEAVLIGADSAKNALHRYSSAWKQFFQRGTQPGSVLPETEYVFSELPANIMVK